jgi:hypothetical protein
VMAMRRFMTSTNLTGRPLEINMQTRVVIVGGHIPSAYAPIELFRGFDLWDSPNITVLNCPADV